MLAGEGADPSIAVLDAGSLASAESAQSTTLAAVLAREDGGEDPSFELGTGVSSSKLCVVLNGVPNGDLCTLSLVVDDQRVHATDLGIPPVLPVGQFPANDKVPLVVGLNASFGQGAAEPRLSASWFPAADVVYYIADVTYDNGVTWQNVYQAIGNSFAVVVTLAALTLRVQAVNSKGVRGQYSTVSVTAPTIEVIPQAVALQSLIDGIRYQVTTLQDQVANTVSQVTQQISAVSSNLAARDVLDKKELRSELVAQAGGAKAAIAELQQVVVDDQEAFATYQTEVSASFGNVNAAITTNATAIATLNGYAAASYALTLDVNHYVTGYQLVNGGPGASAFTVIADIFQVAKPGVAGGAPVPIFTIGSIGGSPKIGIRGDMLIDGTTTGAMIQAGTIQAVNIAAGAITADKIQAGSISTAQLAVGGVSLQNIINGAVSNTGVVDLGGASFARNVTRMSAGFDVQSGRCTVRYEDEWSNTGNYPNQLPQPQIQFLVDGGVVKTFTFTMIPIGNNNWMLQTPFICEHTIEGLTAGVHTFAIVILANGVNCVLVGGQAYLTDFRR